jgi:hypothetical protein
MGLKNENDKGLKTKLNRNSNIIGSSSIDDDVRIDLNAGKQKMGRNHASSFDEENN